VQYSTAAQTLDNIVWPNTTLHLREQVESMFYSYGVDLYLCGHVHGYERMWPVYQNVTQQKNYNNPSVFTHLVREWSLNPVLILARMKFCAVRLWGLLGTQKDCKIGALTLTGLPSSHLTLGTGCHSIASFKLVANC
jgi:hypothetical protein